MRRSAVLLAALLLGGSAFREALAAPATCTIVPGGLVHGIAGSAAGSLSWTISQADDLVLPLDLASDGKFTITLAGLRRSDGSAVMVDPSDSALARCTSGRPALADTLEYVTAPGPEAFIHLESGGPLSGAIDSLGGVVLRSFPINLTTTFTAPECTTFLLAPTLTTGLSAGVLSGGQITAQGRRLDFATGRVTLSGTAFIDFAPGSSGTIFNVFTLTCVLKPIPSSASLAPAVKAFALSHVRGLATVSPPLGDTPPKKSDRGDTLRLVAGLVPGATPLDFAGQDLFIAVAGQVGGQETELVQLRVRKGTLRTKGKRTSTRDTDGSQIEVVIGRKKNKQGSVKATVSGSIAIVAGKKGATLTLQERGLDLGGVSGTVSARVSLGSENIASADVLVSGTGKRRTLKGKP